MPASCQCYHCHCADEDTEAQQLGPLTPWPDRNNSGCGLRQSSANKNQLFTSLVLLQLFSPVHRAWMDGSGISPQSSWEMEAQGQTVTAWVSDTQQGTV